ncbi:hypothetical protein M2146_001052 [Lachnospiraceae bacterium PF1-22]
MGLDKNQDNNSFDEMAQGANDAAQGVKRGVDGAKNIKDGANKINDIRKGMPNSKANAINNKPESDQQNNNQKENNQPTNDSTKRDGPQTSKAPKGNAPQTTGANNVNSNVSNPNNAASNSAKPVAQSITKGMGNIGRAGTSSIGGSGTGIGNAAKSVAGKTGKSIARTSGRVAQTAVKGGSNALKMLVASKIGAAFVVVALALVLLCSTIVSTGIIGNNKGCSSAGDGTVPGQIWMYLDSKGVEDVQKAAILGNIQAESGFNPGTVEGGSGIGFGLCQWSFGRRTTLESWASSNNKDVASVDTQMDFFWMEYSPDAERASGVAFQWIVSAYSYEKFVGTTDIAEATTIFCHGWERCQVNESVAHLQSRRIPQAQFYYDKYAGTG